MNARVENVTVRRVVYEAFDGTQFENERECLDYEAKHASQSTIAADEIPHTIVCRDYIDACACEADLVLVFFPKTFNDMLTIEAWAKENQVEFDIGKMPIGEPILFDIGEYVYSAAYDSESLRGCYEVYRCIGTMRDLKISYCNAIDVMVEAARKNAKVVR